MTFPPPESPQQPTPPVGPPPVVPPAQGPPPIVPPAQGPPPIVPPAQGPPPIVPPQPNAYTAPAQPTPYAAPVQPGAPAAYGQQPYSPPAQTEGLAIGALIGGILFWPAGVVLSLMAMSKIKKTGNGGRGLAIAGLILSIVGFLGTIIGIIALVVIATSTATAVQSVTDSLESGSMGGEVSQSVTLGETGVTANGIGYTVSAVECGIATVGDEYSSVDASGQFCKVSLNVVNNDTEPFTYLSSYAAAYVGESEFAPSSDASIYSAEDVVIIEDLNPGASLDTSIYFDVPADATISRLTFTESYGEDVIEVTP